MLHRCYLCVKLEHNNAAHKTDDLYLRNIDGQDQLVCEFHRGNHENGSSNTETIVPTLP